MADMPQNRKVAIQTARQTLEQNPVYLDTETTGLDANAEIVEIALIEHDGTQLFQSLVRPQQPIPDDAIQIHHITNPMVQTAPTWPVIWTTLRPLLLGRVIAAYNADFDHRMMKQSLTQYRLPWKENLRMFDIMKLYAQFRGEWDARRNAYRYFSLEQAGRTSRLDLPNSHRAADDCLLARSLLIYMANQPLSDS